MFFVSSWLVSCVGRSPDVVAQSAHAASNMVLIPAGEFWMGRTHTTSLEQAIILERDRRDDQPAHKIFVDAFYLDKYEVANTDYARFVEATGAARPWQWPGGKVAKAEERWPVSNVNWAEADSYCRWAGKRLPSEAEWERGARGGLDRKRFPWGDQGGRGRAHTGSATGPTAVGSFPANDFGLFDMAGNVWEWTERLVRARLLRDQRAAKSGRARERRLQGHSRRRLDRWRPDELVPQLRRSRHAHVDHRVPVREVGWFRYAVKGRALRSIHDSACSAAFRR